jgi:hypothetical protein
MSVAAVLIGYSGTMLLAAQFGTDGARDKLPTTTAMATLSLVTGALAMTSPTPPKKGEPGYITHMAAVHVGLLEPLVFAGVKVCSVSPVKHRLTCVGLPGVQAYRAYNNRNSASDLIPPAALAVSHSCATLPSACLQAYLLTYTALRG